MGKKIESPVEKFSGYVIISDPMTMPQVLAIEEALITSNAFFDDKKGNRILKPDVLWSAPDKEYLKGAILCVEEWHLGNMPESITSDTFPFTPRAASRQLIHWLFDEVLKVYAGEIEVPNE